MSRKRTRGGHLYPDRQQKEDNYSFREQKEDSSKIEERWRIHVLRQRKEGEQMIR